MLYNPQKTSFNDLLDVPNFKQIATSGEYSDLSNVPDFKPIATSGKYSDLLDLPLVINISYTGGSYTDQNNYNVLVSRGSFTKSYNVNNDCIEINSSLIKSTSKIVWGASNSSLAGAFSAGVSNGKVFIKQGFDIASILVIL